MEEKGEIIRLSTSVSPVYMVPALIHKHDGAGPIIIKKLENHDTRVVANVCASRDSICEALGVDRRELNMHLFYSQENPTPCKVVETSTQSHYLSLLDIPVLTHYSGEQGPYITAGLVYAKNSKGYGNVSYHRLDVLDKETVSISIQPGHLAEIIEETRESGKKYLDISISIGNHPAVMMAAALRPSRNICEYDVANTLLGGTLELYKCPNVDALAPVHSELVLEARLMVDELADEGPYVCVTGTLKPAKKMPVVKIISAINRDDYLYQGLLGAGTEHRLLESIPNEVKIWDKLTKQGHKIKGVHMTPSGSSWLHCVVSAEKQTDDEPRKMLNTVFDAVRAVKHVIVVDDDINVFDQEAVEWALATRFQADKDLMILPETYASRLDPSSNQEKKTGCKLGFDATIPLDDDKSDYLRAKIPFNIRATCWRTVGF